MPTKPSQFRIDLFIIWNLRASERERKGVWDSVRHKGNRFERAKYASMYNNAASLLYFFSLYLFSFIFLYCMTYEVWLFGWCLLNHFILNEWWKKHTYIKSSEKELFPSAHSGFCVRAVRPSHYCQFKIGFHQVKIEHRPTNRRALRLPLNSNAMTTIATNKTASKSQYQKQKIRATCSSFIIHFATYHMYIWIFFVHWKTIWAKALVKNPSESFTLLFVWLIFFRSFVCRFFFILYSFFLSFWNAQQNIWKTYRTRRERKKHTHTLFFKSNCIMSKTKRKEWI